MMTALAGTAAGILMALIFVGHAAIVLVYHMPAFAEVRAQREGPSGLPALMVAMAGLSVFIWAALGAGAALLFSQAEDSFPTGSGVVPSVTYLAVVSALALTTAPLPFAFFWRLRGHLLFEYGVFLVIFGLMVPWLVEAA